jgi:hypothetical protein
LIAISNESLENSFNCKNSLTFKCNCIKFWLFHRKTFKRVSRIQCVRKKIVA